MRDEIFREPLSTTTGFEFDQRVTEVFDDMLNRSIPFYHEVQSMILNFMRHFYSKGSTVYDLGCSTGLMIARMMTELEKLEKIVGIDNSKPMIEKTRERLEAIGDCAHIELTDLDLRDVPIENASVVIMNYTLQFIRPLYRPNVLKKIYEGLRPGGIFILSEKVLEDSMVISQLFIDMYYDFKRRQGYSDLEISQKRERLENVLIPYKMGEHQEMLAQAGFNEIEVFFKWHNFTSFIAIKQL